MPILRAAPIGLRLLRVVVRTAVPSSVRQPRAAFSIEDRTDSWQETFMASGFLGTPDTDVWLFIGMVIASFLTNYFSIVAGTAGGLLLLVLMASFYAPAVLIPMHTLIQLGSGITRTIAMWKWVIQGTLLPFTVGCLAGAAVGAKLFVSIPQGLLMGVLGVFVLIMTWAPQLGRFGGVRDRFAGLGFGVTVLGVFVSATGTIVGPFVAAASPDRRNHVATMAALMAITHTAKMMAFAWVGFALSAYVPLIAAMIAGGMFGNLVGEKTLTRMKEEWFRVSFKVVMTVLALRLLWMGLVELKVV